MRGIDRSQLRQALRAWHQTDRLGALPPAQLTCVAALRAAEGYADTPAGRGLALRQLLRRLIDDLRPAAAPPDPADRRWRPFIILNEQYVNGRSPDWVAAQLFLARRTYYKAQRRALERLLDGLRAAEQAAGKLSPAASVPFLAPPRINRPFVGRADLLQTIRSRLTSGSTPRLGLLGLPGVGKTALLRELAHDPALRAAFPDGVLWAGLGQNPDLPALLGGWARALGAGERALTRAQSVAARAALVHARLGGRRALLLVDDAWEGDHAVTFHLGGPQCAALLTTRLRPVAHDFAGSDVLSVASFDRAESAAYLTALVGGDSVSAEDHARLVGQLGGLPLALSLAVRYLRHHAHDVTGALQALDDAATRLALHQPQSPLLQQGIPRSLGGAVALSVDVLTPPARRLLATLALLPPRPGSVARDTITELGDAAALDELLDAGLLEPLGTGRLSIHQTIADFMRSRLADEADHHRLVDTFVNLVEKQREDDDRLESELDNVSAVLDLADRRHNLEALSRALVALEPFTRRRGHLLLAQRLLEAAMARDLAHLPVSLRAQLQLALGDNAARRGDNFVARAAVERARALDDSPAVAARAANALGNLYFRLGNLAQAEAELTQAIEQFSSLANEDGAAAARSNRALCLLQRGEHDLAAAAFAGIIASCRARQETFLQTKAWHNLGFANLLRQDYDAAAAAYGEALRLARATRNRLGEGAALADLGAVRGQQGDTPGAQRHYRQALQIARASGDDLTAAMILSNLGNITTDLGLFEEAENYLDQALAIARRSGYLRQQGSAEIHYCRLALLAGGLDEATSAGERALEIARAIDDAGYELEALILLGRVALAQGVPAGEPVRAALTLARQNGPRGTEGEALAGLAAASLAAGDATGAQRLLGELAALQSAGVDLPRHAILTWYETAQALGDPAAPALIAAAYDDLQAAAARLDDPRLRHAFLHNPADNRAIVEAYRAA